MDRERLAEFLRARREALQPEDVGLPRGPRRRTGGLRREEVAVLSDMSIDYYNRLEQKRGPRPSEQMLSALARGLRLALEDRDHMFHLAGYAVPHRGLRADHLNPGMQRIVDGLGDAAAQVVNGVGESLHPAVGPLELHCQTLLDPDQSQALVVYTATPGTESHDKLDLLRVLGPQPLDTGR